MKTFAEKISPIIIECSEAIIDYNCYVGTKPNYDSKVLPAAARMLLFATSNILSSATMDKMFELMDKEKIQLSDRKLMAASFGEELRLLIVKYTGLDPHDLSKEYVENMLNNGKL